MNQLLGLDYLLLGVRHDEAVQVFVLIAGMRSVRFPFALLDRAFAANGDLGLRLSLHLLQCVATWTDQKADC